MIKILHVFGSLDAGGAETSVLNLYKKIDKNKYDFSFVVHGTHIGIYENILKEKGVKIFHAPRYKIYNHYQYKKFWEKFLEHRDYDIVHAHMRSTAKIYTKIASNYSIKTIIHSHSSSENKGLKGIIQKYIYQKNITNHSDMNLAVSETAGKYLFGNKEFKIIFNGIDYDKFMYSESYSDILKMENNLQNSIVLGSIGRIETVKNHKFLLKLISKLDIRYKLIIIGDGTKKRELNKEIVRQGLENRVKIVDPKIDIHQYYSMFDIFLFPSIKEGLGNVGIEAQINGLTVICSNGVPRDIKISNSVYFLATNEVNEWIDIIKTGINFNRSGVLLDSKFDLKNIVTSYEKAYSSLVKNKV